MSEADLELLNACNAGSLERIERALLAGANINCVQEGVHTPLNNAAHKQNYYCVRFLLERGADPELQNDRGHTALSYTEGACAELLRQWNNLMMPGQVTNTRSVSDRIMEEIYDFQLLERITFVRNPTGGAVEAVTRERFQTLAESDGLRKAFNEHVRRGGKRSEEEVFTSDVHAMLSKIKMRG